MRKTLFILLSWLFLVTSAYPATQTINTVPSANANFITNIQTFLENESPERDALLDPSKASQVVSGGIGSTSASLTHTISTVVAFINGYYVTNAAVSHTYTASKRTFAYLRYSTSQTVTISSATITYDGNFVFVEMAAATAFPGAQTGCISLFYVDTNGTAITSVTDLRQETVNSTIFYVDYRAVDQGTTGDSNTLKYYIDTVAADNATIVLRNNSGGTNTDYVLSTSETIPSNITIKIEPGARFSVASGKTLTIYSPANIKAQKNQQIKTGDGKLTFSTLGIVYPNWWQFNTTPGTTDMRTAIQAAIVSGAGTVKFLSETYLLTKGSSKTDEAGNNYACLVMTSNMHIKGEGSAKLKLADNQSSDAASVNIAMFLSTVPLSNISFDGIEIDMNGANNKVNGTAWTFAPILFSGTTGGVAARGDYVTIKNCKFRNTPGVTVIGMAQSNTSGITLGKYWTIENCLFENNGLDTTDHSSIYAYAENVIIKNCIFTQDAMYDNATGLGMRAAIEIHGRNTEVSGNIILNSWLGIYISTTYVPLHETANILVHDNIMEVARTGVYWSRDADTDAEERFIKCSNNTIVLWDVAHGDAIPKSGFEIAGNYPSTEIEIDGNTIRRQDGHTIASAGVLIGCPTAGQQVSKVTITNNKAYETTYGVYSYNTTGGVKDIIITDNKWYDLVESSLVTPPVGVFFANNGAITSDVVVIKRNTAIDVTGISAVDYGIYVDGKITTLWLDDNDNIGINTDISLDASEITNFYGTFPIVSTGYDPPSLADGAGTTATSISVPGASFGDTVEVIAPYDLQGIICTGYVQAENTVAFRLQNETTGVVDLASGTWKIRVKSNQ